MTRFKMLVLISTVLWLTIPMLAQTPEFISTPEPVSGVIFPPIDVTPLPEQPLPDVEIVETIPLEVLYLFGGILVILGFIITVQGRQFQNTLTPVLQNLYNSTPTVFRQPVVDSIGNIGDVAERVGDQIVLRVPGELDDEAWSKLKDFFATLFSESTQKPTSRDLDADFLKPRQVTDSWFDDPSPDETTPR